jgi:hypothetical protein
MSPPYKIHTVIVVTGEEMEEEVPTEETGGAFIR